MKSTNPFRTFRSITAITLMLCMEVNLVLQALGRVLLNLINNAFYAVNEKAKSGIEGYKP